MLLDVVKYRLSRVVMRQPKLEPPRSLEFTVPLEQNNHYTVFSWIYPQFIGLVLESSLATRELLHAKWQDGRQLEAFSLNNS
jgi:hypothetical protein